MDTCFLLQLVQKQQRSFRTDMFRSTAIHSIRSHERRAHGHCVVRARKQLLRKIYGRMLILLFRLSADCCLAKHDFAKRAA